MFLLKCLDQCIFLIELINNKHFNNNNNNNNHRNKIGVSINELSEDK